MKRIYLVIFVCLILGGAGGYFAWRAFNGGSGNSSSSSPAPSAGSSSSSGSFMWGITARPSGLGRYSDDIWAKQLGYAQPLGVKWVRVAWDFSAEDKINDEIVKLIQDYNFNPYVVIEPEGDFAKVKDPYDDGYKKAYEVASRNKGKIKYYQLMNEASGNAIKGGQYTGEKDSDYDTKKYERTRDWIKGAAAGVKKADSTATRVVTSQWLHVGFLEKLKKDKVDYDAIGWDWFSDMGMMGEKKLSSGTLLIDKLQSFDKPIIVAECNYRPEGKNGQKGQPEAKQADYIDKMATWAYNAKLKGFIVLELFDGPDVGGRGYTDYYGIVGVEKSASGSWVPGEPRKAYGTYQAVVKKFSQ